MLQALFNSLDLTIKSIIISITLGITFGIISYKYKFFRYINFLTSILIKSFPSFIVAFFFQYFLAYKLSLLPVARYLTFKHTILPSIALASSPIFLISRMFLKSLDNIYEKNYVKLARLRGFSEIQLFKNYVFPNAFQPIISYLGKLFSYMLISSVVIERVFVIRGLGNLFIESLEDFRYFQTFKIVLIYLAIVNIVFYLVSLLEKKI